MSRPVRRLLAPFAALIACLATLCLMPGAALADHSQISSFQDDQYLIYSSQQTVISTLGTLERLGVQEVRVNVEWNTIAPDPMSTTIPGNGFNPADPATYPASGWAPYDFLVQQAALAGIKVQFNLTGPVPLWAVAPNAPVAKLATHWYPNAIQFYAFAYAVGKRYSGMPGEEPAVTNWSIWNEPNQPGWLAPQWVKVGKTEVPESAVLYRALANGGYYGLYYAGHTPSNNTILIGETAPEGDDSGGVSTAVTPLPFLQTLYCVNAKDKRLTGTAATQVGCPASGSAKSFVSANLGLFNATGFAHHPYDFSHSPRSSLPDKNEAPLADISRLETMLDKTFSAYGIKRQIPLYFTEYGYETNPPDPHKVVSPAEQAAYLNESDYLSWENPRVKQIAQFLLYDSPPNPAYTPTQYDYWDTFQSGLLYANGTAKPSFAAYRMPLWIPTPTARKGARTFVWGQLRPDTVLKKSEPILIQWKAAKKGTWRTIATAKTVHTTGYYDLDVRLPGTGSVRAVWKASATASDTSRTQAVTVK